MNKRIRVELLMFGVAVVVLFVEVCFLIYRTRHREYRTAPGTYVYESLTISPLPSGEQAGEGTNVNKLVQTYDDEQEKIQKISIEGWCHWSGFPLPSPIHVEFDRTKQEGIIHCSNRACSMHGTTVRTSEPSMQVDAMYFLMFREFDSRTFSDPVDDILRRTTPSGLVQSIAVKIVRSDKAKLAFDAQTGKLLEASIVETGGRYNRKIFDIHNHYGRITIDFYNYIIINDRLSIEIPSDVFVDVPDSILQVPWGLDQKSTIHLSINVPNTVINNMPLVKK